MDAIRQIRFVWKPTIFLLCLVPAALVVTDLYEITGTLGANPVEAMLDRFGIWSIRFIMITLAVTPLRKLSGWNWLTRFRRMFGLFTFFYVLMHFLVWLMLDRGLYFSALADVLPAVVEDLTERTFITLGFTALVLLTAMAVTSTAGMRRRMGRRWQKLHYSAYAVGTLGVWHYWWQVKKGPDDAIYYAAILAVLLGLRAYWYLQKRKKKLRPTPRATTTP
jgi:sulfoxide reductase heme-binding subunit YedZ